MLPFNKGDDSEDIRLAKDRLNQTYGAGLDLQSTVYDAAMKAAVADKLGEYTGEPAGKSGDKINARMWNGLLKDFIKKQAVTSPPPIDTSPFIRKGETVVIKGSS